MRKVSIGDSPGPTGDGGGDRVENRTSVSVFRSEVVSPWGGFNAEGAAREHAFYEIGNVTG